MEKEFGCLFSVKVMEEAHLHLESKFRLLTICKLVRNFQLFSAQAGFRASHLAECSILEQEKHIPFPMGHAKLVPLSSFQEMS